MVAFRFKDALVIAHYQPVFFEELAQANNYDILGSYYTIAHPEIYTIFPFPFSRELLDTIHNRFSFDISPYLYEEELGYILRKNSDSGFSLPYQTGQLKDNKLNVNLLTDITTKELVYSEPDISIDDYIKTFAKKSKLRGMWDHFSRVDTREKVRMGFSALTKPFRFWNLISK